MNDGPENHLHPELQRNLLPSLLEAFDKAQFIVASHNPFIVSSVPDSHVYVLGYNKRKKVVSNKLDIKSLSGSTNDVLRDVLGLRLPLPKWVEVELDRIVAKYRKEGFTESAIESMRLELAELGLEDYSASVIADLSDSSE